MKTRIEAVAEALQTLMHPDLVAPNEPADFVKALDAAGYVIAPIEPTKFMVDCMMRGFHKDEEPRQAMRDAYTNCMLGYRNTKP